jgi:hypothetical protein
MDTAELQATIATAADTISPISCWHAVIFLYKSEVTIEINLTEIGLDTWPERVSSLEGLSMAQVDLCPNPADGPIFLLFFFYFLLVYPFLPFSNYNP